MNFSPPGRCALLVRPLFPPCRPLETPTEGAVHVAVTGKVAVDAFDADAAAVVNQAGDGAHAVLRVAVGEVGFDFLPLHMEGDDAVSSVPVRHTVVDEGEDEDFGDIRPARTVDVQPFAVNHRTGAVVAAQAYIRRAVEAAEAVAKRLHAVALIVFQADKGAEIEVNPLVFIEETAEEAAFLRGGAGVIPVEVDADGAVIRLLGEADSGVAFIEGDFAEAKARRGSRGGFGWSLCCLRWCRRRGGVVGAGLGAGVSAISTPNCSESGFSPPL